MLCKSAIPLFGTVPRKTQLTLTVLNFFRIKKKTVSKLNVHQNIVTIDIDTLNLYIHSEIIKF